MEIMKNQMNKNESFGTVQVGSIKHPLTINNLKEKSKNKLNIKKDANSDQKQNQRQENPQKQQNITNIKHHVRFSEEGSVQSPQIRPSPMFKIQTSSAGPDEIITPLHQKKEKQFNTQPLYRHSQSPKSFNASDSKSQSTIQKINGVIQDISLKQEKQSPRDLNSTKRKEERKIKNEDIDYQSGYQSGYNNNESNNSTINFKRSPRVLKVKSKPPLISRNYQMQNEKSDEDISSKFLKEKQNQKSPRSPIVQSLQKGDNENDDKETSKTEQRQRFSERSQKSGISDSKTDQIQQTNKLTRKKSFSSVEFTDQLMQSQKRLENQKSNIQEHIDKVQISEQIDTFSHNSNNQQRSPSFNYQDQLLRSPKLSEPKNNENIEKENSYQQILRNSQRSNKQSNMKSSSKKQSNDGKTQEDENPFKEANESLRAEVKIDQKIDHIKNEEAIEKQSNGSTDFFNDLIEKFMDENELQFEVFETDQDGELKPIFMVGKCHPLERESLRRSINSVLNQDAKDQKQQSPNNTIDEEKDFVQNLSYQNSKMGVPKINSVVLSVIQSETHDETSDCNAKESFLKPQIAKENIALKNIKTRYNLQPQQKKQVVATAQVKIQKLKTQETTVKKRTPFQTKLQNEQPNENKYKSNFQINKVKSARESSEKSARAKSFSSQRIQSVTPKLNLKDTQKQPKPVNKLGVKRAQIGLDIDNRSTSRMSSRSDQRGAQTSRIVKRSAIPIPKNPEIPQKMKVKSISISNKQILTQRNSGKSDRSLPKKDQDTNSNKLVRPILTHRQIEKKPEELSKGQEPPKEQNPFKVSNKDQIINFFSKYELPKDDEDEIEGDVNEHQKNDNLDEQLQQGSNEIQENTNAINYGKKQPQNFIDILQEMYPDNLKFKQDDLRIESVEQRYAREIKEEINQQKLNYQQQAKLYGNFHKVTFIKQKQTNVVLLKAQQKYAKMRVKDAKVWRQLYLDSMIK